MRAPSLSCRVLADSITIATALLLLGGTLRAAPQFASGVNLVEVYASVTNEKGEPVEGLTKDDFTILEDNVPQTVSAFAAADFPLSVAIALDRSFSMAGERLSVAKSAARIFLGELRAQDEAAVLAIGSEVDTVAPLSTDRRAQYDALTGIDAFGTTGLYDAVVAAIDLTQVGKGRRALVLLSDGTDRYSKITPGAALERARTSDVMVYPVALRAAAPPTFVELAVLTGGRSYGVRDVKQLPETLRQIARELRHQYLVGYVPARAAAAGQPQWRSIRVVVRKPGVQVRARDGYLAK